MNMRWSLEELYSSFDSEELKNDLELLPKLISGTSEYVDTAFNTNDHIKEKLEKYLEMYMAMQDKIDRLYSFGSLTYSVDTKNPQALKLIEKIESLLPQVTLLEARFDKWLSTIKDFEAVIQSSKSLTEHKFILMEKRKLANYLLSDKEEELIALMKNTGSNAWSKLQDLLTSSLLVNYDNKKLPLSVIRNYAYDSSEAVRKKAYEAELKAYKSIDISSASCLNAIKGEVITICNQRGYSSPLEMTLVNSRMDKKTLDAMMIAIKEYLPYFHKYLKKKASLLGHKDGLPFYDLFAPIGNVDMRYSYEEAKDFIINNFTSYSQKLGGFASNAFDNAWIDAEPREGKVGGAFCDNLHFIKQSRIMSNFSGSLNDVTTLAHELGHGYHGDSLKDETSFNSNYPMPIAETASIFCETIVTNAAIKDATEEEKLVILETDLMGSNQVIVDIYSRYLFETELFERRQEASLSVDELNKIMIKAQKEAYGDGLDDKYLHPYMWICKPHYYYASANFYNFPYAFGLLFAKGLYARYIKEGESFIKKYDDLLAATGKNDIKDILNIMGIDSHDPEFFRSSLELIKEDIEKFIKL